MSTVTRLDVLKLYKNLLRYGETLRFTDKSYYKKRIREEFQKNKVLDNPEEIQFSWKVSGSIFRVIFVKFKIINFLFSERRRFIKVRSSCLTIMFQAFSRILLRSTVLRLNNIRLKATIDYSKFPKLIESDLEERWVRGSGPGGQSVNRTANNVVLKHIPTGIIVKCHKTRSLEDNRKEARKILLTKIDNHLNGDNSVEAQTKKFEIKKINESDRKRRKLQEMKQKWKERENIDKK